MKIKTARLEGGLFVWTYRCISAGLRLPFHHPNEKLPTFSGEVGFGRRLRGNANEWGILCGILLEKENESMVFRIFIAKITHLGRSA
jgi:hypothetical protein